MADYNLDQQLELLARRVDVLEHSLLAVIKIAAETTSQPDLKQRMTAIVDGITTRRTTRRE